MLPGLVTVSALWNSQRLVTILFSLKAQFLFHSSRKPSLSPWRDLGPYLPHSQLKFRPPNPRLLSACTCLRRHWSRALPALLPQHTGTAVVLLCPCWYISESLNKLLADLQCLQARCSRHFPYCCHRVRHMVLPAKVFPPDTRQPHDYCSLWEIGESAPQKRDIRCLWNNQHPSHDGKSKTAPSSCEKGLSDLLLVLQQRQVAVNSGIWMLPSSIGWR